MGGARGGGVTNGRGWVVDGYRSESGPSKHTKKKYRRGRARRSRLHICDTDQNRNINKTKFLIYFLDIRGLSSKQAALKKIMNNKDDDMQFKICLYLKRD